MLITRMNGIIDRIRSLNAIADDDPTQAHLKADLTGCGPDPPSILWPRAA
jgi:hypothetical protein